MIVSLTILALSQYPDAIDHLRARDLVPQVGLILDRSCSMGGGWLNTECDWFADEYNWGSRWFNKSEQMKASLVGCRTRDDGVLTRWYDRMNFSILEFGSGNRLNAPFFSDLETLKDGVMRVPITGGTEMARALATHGEYFDDFFDTSNTEVCKPNFLVFLSDGNPNGGNATFDWECTPPRERRRVNRNRPWEGADYMWKHPDLLCGVPGDQKISTYSIGFGGPGSFNPNNLQRIADSGGGEYVYASNVDELSGAFERIISSLQARSALFFAPIAIESGSLFPDNYAYVSSFRPTPAGPWVGNLKKYCVLPEIMKGGLFDTSTTECLLSSPDGTTLETNPAAEDLWSGSTNLASDAGGAGAIALEKLGVPGEAPVGSLYERPISTYRPGEASYVHVDPKSWGEDDAFSHGCNRWRLLNSLHGYSRETDCETGRPEAVGDWPIGDPVHANPVFLRYGECNGTNGEPKEETCFLALPANDGMLHIFDAANGKETAALIPGELWRPNHVPNSLMADRFDQPGTTYTHRFYVDGRAQLVHIDKDSDFAIDEDEQAYVLFSLGRGGRAHYLLDVSRLGDGELDSDRTPVYPLGPAPGTVFEQMRDTISPPWVGRLQVHKESPAVAVFASGHEPDLDFDDVASGARIVRPPQTPGAVVEGACDGPGGLSDQSRLGPAGFCDAYHTPDCEEDEDDCYDSFEIPLDDASIPLTWTDGVHATRAIRLYFDAFDLEEDDVLQIEDNQGTVLQVATKSELENQWTRWVYDDNLTIRLVTDGEDEGGTGFRIAKVQVITGRYTEREAPGPADEDGPSPGFELGVDHRPEVWAVALDRWNGSDGPVAFEATASNAAVKLRVTSSCATGGAMAADTICIDSQSAPDLRDMVCPISSEVSAFMNGAQATALYWGDECGQIWKAWTEDDGTSWKARRLISLNRGKQGYGPDFRKIFTRLDLVESRCPGREVVGIYFGTGDVQKPGALDMLRDSDLNSGRDILGVLWDDGKIPDGIDQRRLVDATNVDEIDPVKEYERGMVGWMLQLEEHERMIRDPLVAEGAAFFKTFTPVPSTAQCESASGVDRIYSVDNCSVAASQDVNGDGVKDRSDRKKWEGNTEGGASLFVYTPKETGIIVSHGDLSRAQKAELNVRRRRPGLFLWRELE